MVEQAFNDQCTGANPRYPLMKEIKEIMAELHEEELRNKVIEEPKPKISGFYLKYQEIQKQYPSAVIIYRLGDFYELFFDDAKVASRELELVLTGKNAGVDERVPMCGVPHHASKIYIARLLRLGKKIAICEQVTPPSKGKGLTERKVVEVISPGNVLEHEYLEQGANNFLGCFCFVKDFAAAARRYSAGKTLAIIGYFRDTDARLKGINNPSAKDADLWKELIYKIMH